jgi:hypothetical protein
MLRLGNPYAALLSLSWMGFFVWVARCADSISARGP